MVTGDAGRHSDGGVLSNSEFGQALDEELLSIPDDQPLLNTALTTAQIILYKPYYTLLTGTTEPNYHPS